MDNDSLNETLVKLRDELRYAPVVDDSARDSLQRLDGDIHRILQSTGDVPPAHHVRLRESLQDSVQYFEASHPTITALMNQLLKALGDMGI
ncbi:MAG: DUF4404 family protein [Candidatus Aminicenantes bacterium]|nr:DUF4404 family protein [Candidatus Aminicenantes bacterium]